VANVIPGENSSPTIPASARKLTEDLEETSV